MRQGFILRSGYRIVFISQFHKQEIRKNILIPFFLYLKLRIIYPTRDCSKFLLLFSPGFGENAPWPVSRSLLRLVKDATLPDLPRSLFPSPSDIISPGARENEKPSAVRSHFSPRTPTKFYIPRFIRSPVPPFSHSSLEPSKLPSLGPAARTLPIIGVFFEVSSLVWILVVDRQLGILILRIVILQY